jgi:hypothetical protein
MLDCMVGCRKRLHRFVDNEALCLWFAAALFQVKLLGRVSVITASALKARAPALPVVAEVWDTTCGTVRLASGPPTLGTSPRPLTLC